MGIIMSRRLKLTHQFVEFLPDKLEDGVLYISIEYKTVAHRCLCGCGNEVNTPLSPAGWRLTFDGDSISLHPSIGNWGFACQSHYWIERNHVKWAGRFSQEEIREVRQRDALARETYQGSVTSTAMNSLGVRVESGSDEPKTSNHPELTLWQRLKQFIGR
jgi:Family of unknown function (DUF6527)